MEGADEEKPRKFRQVRDQIEARILAWLRDGPGELDAELRLVLPGRD